MKCGEGHVSLMLTRCYCYRKVVRIITGSSNLAHTKPLFFRTGILKMRELHVYLLAVHSYKENNLSHLIYPNHQYNTRTRDRAILAFQRLSSTQKSI